MGMVLLYGFVRVCVCVVVVVLCRRKCTSQIYTLPVLREGNLGTLDLATGSNPHYSPGRQLVYLQFIFET